MALCYCSYYFVEHFQLMSIMLIREGKYMHTNSIKDTVQTRYEVLLKSNSFDDTIKILETEYDKGIITKYILEQTCIDCDKLFTTYSDRDEQTCDEHAEYNTYRPQAPHKDASNDEWRQYGEQLASLDDDEVYLYERDVYNEEY